MEMDSEKALSGEQDPPPTYGSGDGAPAGDAPAYTSDPPPSYDSVMGKIRNIKDTSEGNTDMAQKFCALVFCSTVGFIITIAFSLAIPIAHITIGAIYLHDCQAERMIPIYLIVCGTFVLLKGLLGCGEMAHKKKTGQEDNENYERPKAFTCCDGPIGCFLFAWFIAGNVWIFRTKSKYQSDTPGLDDYCDQTLYLYAFWVTVAGYIIMGVMLLLCCLIGCCACCCAGTQKART